MEFEGFNKIPRFNRTVVVTEKIDGSNGCIVIEPSEAQTDAKDQATAIACDRGDGYRLYVQSRKRIIRPNEDAGKGSDNFGFALWVKEHADELVHLGPGRHFGEWWGEGIQRAYGLDHKRFSLFNVHRWHDAEANGLGKATCPPCCNVVPALAQDARPGVAVEKGMAYLREQGSAAAPGFADPEGVIAYHTAARQMFKVTVEGDEKPKSQA